MDHFWIVVLGRKWINNISQDGLKVLATNANHHPSITQISLDYNRIDFDADFLDEVIKPLSEKAGIINLDLTLNFIPKGHLFEEIVNGRLTRIHYDRLLMEQKLLSYNKLKTKRIRIKTFFSASACIYSTRCEPRHKKNTAVEHQEMHPVTSLIASIDKNNLDKIIDIDWGIIGFFATKTSLKNTIIGEHAYLMLEGISSFRQRYLIRGDLYATKEGGVRITASQCSPRDFINFTSKGEKTHCRSGKFTREEMKAVLKRMDDFRRKEQPFSDYQLLQSDTEGTYNCLKWAFEMLKAAGIKKDLTPWLPSSELRRKSTGCIITA